MSTYDAIETLRLARFKLDADDGGITHRTIAFDMAIEALEQQEKSRWIPVTKRLPEEDTDVLITYRYKEGEGDTAHSYIDITSYGQMCFGGRAVEGVKHWRPPFECFASNYKVVAWRPLPEPYKEENE